MVSAHTRFSAGGAFAAVGRRGCVLYFDAESARLPDAPEDPIVQRFVAHLSAQPLGPGEHAVMLLCALDQGHGDRPSAVQGAVWLDIKRKYMELRPNLRRVYSSDSAAAFADYDGASETLGFSRFDSLEVDGVPYVLSVLDMGAGSVDGWLAGLVPTELGIEPIELLDVDAHDPILDGRRVPLTQLEFEVMSYLSAHTGKVATRVALESEVWGYDYHGGSNVVDAVVKSLRKKLGERADSSKLFTAATIDCGSSRPATLEDPAVLGAGIEQGVINSVRHGDHACLGSCGCDGTDQSTSSSQHVWRKAHARHFLSTQNGSGGALPASVPSCPATVLRPIARTPPYVGSRLPGQRPP